MSVAVLCESNLHGMLLAALLAPEQARGEVEVRVVEGLSSGFSFARTRLAVRRLPVAVVIDAESPEPEAALERKHRTEEIIGDASGGVPYHVAVAIPELEILYFEIPDLIRRTFGAVDEHTLELARLSPRRAIARLAPHEELVHACFRLVRALEGADIDAIRATDLIRELIDFVQSAGQSSRRPIVSNA